MASAIESSSMTDQPVGLSDRAADRIAAILSKEETANALRISVEGGGCSGFQYRYDLVSDRDEDDLILEKSGATVLIDPISLPYLDGAVIDFVTDLIGQSFQIKNPNATAACGCGTSFSV